jgi:hypothetical protein
LSNEVQAPDRDIERQERDEVRARSKDFFVGMQVNPSARRRVARVHSDLFKSGDGGLERGGLVASKSADIIGAKNREEKVSRMTEREIESMVTPVDDLRNKRGTGSGKIASKAD